MELRFFVMLHDRVHNTVAYGAVARNFLGLYLSYGSLLYTGIVTIEKYTIESDVPAFSSLANTLSHILLCDILAINRDREQVV